jgi:SAM-dependent methyltransferase
MKGVLQQALSLSLIRAVVMRRSAIRFKFRTFQRSVYKHLRKTTRDDRRQDAAALAPLVPKFVAADRRSFIEGQAAANMVDPSRRYSGILQAHRGSRFRLQLFCLCCNEPTRMLVDYNHCSLGEDGSRLPNWRERLVCPHCDMNNRQRLVAKLIQQFTAQRAGVTRIYLMEQVTPTFQWVRGLRGTRVDGSEYLGPEYHGGQRVHGIRHEDVMDLSYADGSFDLIVSNDVMEHIPDPAKALRECFRVLKPGGEVLATIPFDPRADTTIVRARAGDTGIEHLLPAQYHGNPLSSDGSLVFHDFGWDLLELSRSAGFSQLACEVYSADEFGHLGPGLLVFRFVKPQEPSIE